jgi:hypothetical protein
MPITHADLVNATAQALAPEIGFAYPPNNTRYDWITEIDLVSRMRHALVHGGVPTTSIKINGAGRLAAGATNHDIEIGYPPQPLQAAVEVVYCWNAGQAPVPGATLCNDLQWAAGGQPQRHVVAFFPRMRPGYGIQNHAHSYDLAGQILPPSTTQRLLGECLQFGGLNASSQQMCSNIFVPVANPVSGNTVRYSLSQTVPVGVVRLAIGGALLDRSIVESPNSNMWAIAWSSV